MKNRCLNGTTKNLDNRKSTEKGLQKGWTRATFIVDRTLNEKIKALAYWERLTVKEVVHEALCQYLQARKVKSIPKKTRE